MVRRIIFGVVWFVALYFIGCFLVGAVAGGIAGAKVQPGENAAELGSKAGAAATQRAIPFIAITAIGLASVGSYVGILPGTRPRDPYV